MGWYSVVALKPRPRPPVVAAGAVPPTEHEDDAWATVVLLDVHHGLRPAVPDGTVKRLAVVEEVYKSDKHFDRARGGVAIQLTAISLHAAYTPKRLWGYVDVADDGSARFRVPANRPIYFIAYDAQGRAVQRMRTYTHLMPGETQSCIGCHADRNDEPLPLLRAAPEPTPAEPVPLRPPPWGVAGFSFPGHVQPILDQHCVSCHAPTTDENGVVKPPVGEMDLRGTVEPGQRVSFSRAYRSLMVESHPLDKLREMFVGRGDPTSKPLIGFVPTDNSTSWTVPMVAPMTWGSANSHLADLILSGHRDASGKPRIALSAEERDTLIAWIDLNCPFFPGFGKEDTACSMIVNAY
jgi:hypothetical protein